MAGATEELERGRAAYARRAWTDAHASLTRADQATDLGAGDLELLATSAFMLGGDKEFVAALERAHQAHLGEGVPLRAARCAFWMAMNLVTRGDTAQATGWLGRAQRLLENE